MKDFEKILRMTQSELKLFLSDYLTDYDYDVVAEDGFLYAKGKDPVLLVAHMDRYPDGKNRYRDLYTNRGSIEIYETTDGKTMKHLEKCAQNINVESKTIEEFYHEHYPLKRYISRTSGDKLNDIISEIHSKIAEGKTVWMSPQGICADDRAGVWCIMQLIKEYHTSILFTEDEEIKNKEEHGSVKFRNTNYIKNLGVNYMIQIDRCNSQELRFYKCGNNKFKRWIEQKTGYAQFVDDENQGGKTDITYLMPKCNIAGVNISCGYYNEHYPEEFVVLEEMLRTKDTINKLLSEKVDNVFTADWIED